MPQSIWWYTDATFVGFRVVSPHRKPTEAERARYDLDKPQQTELKDDLIRRKLKR